MKTGAKGRRQRPQSAPHQMNLTASFILQQVQNREKIANAPAEINFAEHIGITGVKIIVSIWGKEIAIRTGKRHGLAHAAHIEGKKRFVTMRHIARDNIRLA